MFFSFKKKLENVFKKYQTNWKNNIIDKLKLKTCGVLNNSNNFLEKDESFFYF